MMRTIPRQLLAGLGIVVLLTSVTAATALAGRSDLDRARSAAARFNSVTQADMAGYSLPPEGPLHECIESSSGGMGFHLINGSMLDTTVDPTRPEALVYAPDANGRLKLVAVEYVVFIEPWQAAFGPDAMEPMLFGEMFMESDGDPLGIPDFYALHAWLWEPNPDGIFASFNPNVSC